MCALEYGYGQALGTGMGWVLVWVGVGMSVSWEEHLGHQVGQLCAVIQAHQDQCPHACGCSRPG